MFLKSLLTTLLSRGIIPDPLLRIGIRYRLQKTLAPFYQKSVEERQAMVMQHVDSLRRSPIALATKEANEQHYEVPTAFFQHVLGKQLKYSSGYWLPEQVGATDLDQAEEAMLQLTRERAGLEDGQKILELGCGWGSLTLSMAAAYPHAQIVAITNSHSQKAYIDQQLEERKFAHVTVRVANMVEYQGEEDLLFDRVVSVEMLEHIKNYQQIFARIASWLRLGGKFFAHIFSHREYPYHYEVGEEEDWLARYFFTGGQMPSHHLFLYFQEELTLQHHWAISGTHYHKTAEAWLEKMDAAREKILPILAATYGEVEQERWWRYWRLFFLACSELWKYQEGNEWLVSHYLFEKVD